jgi:hypothetical protein
MVERDPEKFLAALIDAFRNRQEADTSLKPQYMFFCASMSAVSLRLTALDSLAERFPQACVGANTDLSKRREQNQILFDFFSNTLASIESFWCGSYFVGAAVDPAFFRFGTLDRGTFKHLKRICPKETLKSYETFAPTSAFTKQLRGCLDSDEYSLIDALRNLLVHRIVPGRSIQLSNSREIPPGIDLDQWWEGDMTRIYGGCGFPEPKRVFDLDANCLVRERDWVDNTIDGLAKQLTELALASL